MIKSSSSSIPRRHFIQTATIASVALATQTNKGIAADGKPELIIDCHAHLYGEDETKYPPSSLSDLDRVDY